MEYRAKPTNLNGQYSKKSPVKNCAYQLKTMVNLPVVIYDAELTMGPVLFQENQREQISYWEDTYKRTTFPGEAIVGV